MRVLMVSERFPPQRGGVGVSAHRIARNLAQELKRLDVVHLTADLPAGVVQGRHEDGVHVLSVGRGRKDDESLQLLEQVVRSVLAHHEHDLIHGFFAVPAGKVAVFCAHLAARPAVVSLRGNDLDRAMYHPGRAALLHWTLARADRVLAVSRELAQKAKVLTGRTDEAIRYVPNSVDPQTFRPEPVEGPANQRMVLFSGEMRFKKGLDAVLGAAEELPDDIKIVFLGGVRKEDRPRYDSWRQEFPKAAARIEITRYHRDRNLLREFYNRADLVVHPSLWDGMPNAVLEAMACGRPVLATAVGGIKDLIRHGETGWLLPLEELGDLSGRIVEALRSPERDRIGRAARARTLEEFTPQGETEAHLACYRELL